MTRAVRRFADPIAFEAAFHSGFAAVEIEHSLALGTARHMAARGTAPDDATMLAVLDASCGSVAATALRMPPNELMICCADDHAVDGLADAVLESAIAVPAVIGLAQHAQRFAERIAAPGSRRARLRFEFPFYTLDTLIPPKSPPPGRLRPAEAADATWLIDWQIVFAEESGLFEHERDRDHVAAYVKQATENRRQFIWEWPDGRPATIASYGPTGISGARIGRVLTWPSERGHGTASAAVAALSRHILDNRIASWCGLFTDATNPISNRVYQRLGYREICRFRSIRLD